MVALAVAKNLVPRPDIYLLHDGCPSSLSFLRTVTLLPPLQIQNVVYLGGYYA